MVRIKHLIRWKWDCLLALKMHCLNSWVVVSLLVGNIVFKKKIDKLLLMKTICFNKCPKLHANTSI
jgi:hypothetical protein